MKYVSVCNCTYQFCLLAALFCEPSFLAHLRHLVLAHLHQAQHLVVQPRPLVPPFARLHKSSLLENNDSIYRSAVNKTHFPENQNSWPKAVWKSATRVWFRIPQNIPNVRARWVKKTAALNCKPSKSRPHKPILLLSVFNSVQLYHPLPLAHVPFRVFCGLMIVILRSLWRADWASDWKFVKVCCTLGRKGRRDRVGPLDVPARTYPRPKLIP